MSLRASTRFSQVMSGRPEVGDDAVEGGVFLEGVNSFLAAVGSDDIELSGFR